jgi:hypothetical protein
VGFIGYLETNGSTVLERIWRDRDSVNGSVSPRLDAGRVSQKFMQIDGIDVHVIAAQVAPGNPVYTIGRPFFDRVEMAVGGGKTFTVITRNNIKENRFILEVYLDGKRQ